MATKEVDNQEEIRQYLRERLHYHAHLDSTRVEVAVVGDRVTLTGTVASEWAKESAQDLAESIAGVNEVDNRLRVEPDEESEEKKAAQRQEERGEQRDKDRAAADDHQEKTYNRSPQPGPDPRLEKTDHPAENFSEYRNTSLSSEPEETGEEADYREPDKGKYG